MAKSNCPRTSLVSQPSKRTGRRPARPHATAEPPKWFRQWDAERAHAVRETMGELHFYLVRDVEAGPGHAAHIENSRALIKEYADLLNGNDAIALANLLGNMTWTPIAPRMWQEIAERDRLVIEEYEARQKPRTIGLPDDLLEGSPAPASGDCIEEERP